jgi:arylsulfatase A-like enzyme
MHRRNFLSLLPAAALPAQVQQPARRPNIVVLYSDDLGYGDLSCYGATAVRTPNIDRLAAEGVRFTDAHAPAATCTPSRYSLLTGEYPFRMPKAQILQGDAPALIQPGKPTMASVLREAGYRTSVVGKWHLGLGQGNVDWNREIAPGPLDIGFDESFLVPATGDRVPTVYLENRRVFKLDPRDPIQVNYSAKIGNEPTGRENPELLRMRPSHGHDMTIVNGISRIGWMTGGKAARWVDEEMADVLTRRAIDFISRSRRNPFFLYFSTHDIHVPRAPHPRFTKATGMGPRGNVIAELDWCVGEILKALDRFNLTRNTLVVFSSDNGPVVDDGYHDEAVKRLGVHRPAGPWRGGKYSNFEAGTRVPFLVRWPGQAKSGMVSDALVGQVDLLRSLAAAGGAKVPERAAPDSQDLLPALLGEQRQGRNELLKQASVLSLRQGSWKYIPPSKGPKVNADVNIELGNDPEPQLYDLTADPGESRNLAASHPERVRTMQNRIEEIRNSAY